VTAENELLVAVFDEEAKAEGRTRQEVATEYSQKLRTAIEKYRKDHSAKNIIFASLYTLIITLVFIGALYLIARLYRILNAAIQKWIDSKKISGNIQALKLVQIERIFASITFAIKVTRFVISLVLIYAYVNVTLSFFPWTRPFAGRLLNFLFIPLKTIGVNVFREIPNLIYLSIIVLITVYVLKTIRLLFLGIEKGTISFAGFYPEWAQPTFKICRLLTVAFAAVIAFPYIPGSNSLAFKGITVFLGVLFSIGSSSAVANIISGYILIYRRLFKAGDRVKIGDFVGDVTDTTLQVIHLRTIKNEDITVPSSVIINSQVINYSALAKEKGLILHTKITIGYDAPWRQVEALLLLAAERTHGILSEPPPFVLQTSLDDFYVSYELNVYTDSPQAMAKIYTDLHRNIQDAFNEYDVQIMSPSYETDPDKPKIVPKDQWYAAPAKAPDD
jgi:small-conductance mechanosensitive channel